MIPAGGLRRHTYRREAAFPGDVSLRFVVRPRRGLGLLLATCVATSVPFLATAPAQARQSSRPDRTVRVEADRVDRVPTPRPSWWDCGGLYVAGAQCAMVALPLDYDQPLGPTTRVAVLRLKASDPARRIGTLFVNPGGPGGSGVELAAAAREFLSPEVRARFDVVGFDPRGTNLSSNVRCWPDAAARSVALHGLDPAFPWGTAQEGAAVRSAQAFGSACSAAGPAVLAGSVSTAEVARDMDVLRRMVGDRRLTYLGFSYGTYLGEVYAGLFPDRVRAMALDGVLDPVAWAGTRRTRSIPLTTRIGSAQGTATALSRILRRCRAAGPAYCGLAAKGDPVELYDDLLRSVKVRPIAMHDNGFALRYTYADVVSTVTDMLYSPFGYADVDSFTSFLLEVRAASTTPATRAAAVRGLHRLSVKYAGFGTAQGPSATVRAAWARATGTPVAGYPNGPEAFQAVLCTDGLHPARAGRWPALATAADDGTRGFRRLWAWESAPCARTTWTVADEDAYRGLFDRRTADPVLVVGTVNDPATPYAGAVSTAERLPKARLLTSVSWGHTALGASACVDTAIERYLLRKRLPRKGTRCRGDVQPFDVPLDAGAPASLQALSPERSAPLLPAGRAPVAPLVP